MRTKLYLIITVLFIQSFNVDVLSAQNQNSFSLSNYTEAIINLEYATAMELASASSDLSHQSVLNDLAQVLYYGGQETENKSYHLNLQDDLNEINVIKNLVQAYYNLYHNQTESVSLNYFFEAYSESKRLNNQDLLKLSLLGILEFYHFEFYHTNTHFLNYLTEFKTLAKTPAERSWFYLYDIYFKSQSLFEDERSAEESLILLENEIQKLPKNHKLWPKFLSLKAFQLEYAGKTKESIAYHLEAFELCNDLPFLKYIQFRTCIRLSDVYYKLSEYELGLKYADSARYFRDLSDTLRSEAYIQRYRSANNRALGNFEMAYQELNYYDELRNILDFKENTLKSSSLEIQLQTAEKEKQLLIEKQKVQNNRNIAFALGTSLLALLIIGTLTYKNHYRKQLILKQKQSIHLQNLEKKLQTQENATIDAMLSGQEKERQRLASELHDSIGATLAAAKLQFSHIAKTKNSTGNNDDEIFEKTSSLLNQAYNEVRNIAHLKNSGVIATKGLLPAVKQLAKNASTATGVKFEVLDYGLDKRLENSLEISIYRIIQELVTNIIKHANATQAIISMTQHESTINIIVEDNGKGFNSTKIDKNGMGLSNLEKKIDLMEGTLEIDSSPKSGTTIIIDLPI